MTDEKRPVTPTPLRRLRRAVWIGAIIMLGAELMLSLTDYKVSLGFIAGLLWMYVVNFKTREGWHETIEAWRHSNNEWKAVCDKILGDRFGQNPRLTDATDDKWNF